MPLKILLFLWKQKAAQMDPNASVISPMLHRLRIDDWIFATCVKFLLTGLKTHFTKIYWANNHFLMSNVNIPQLKHLRTDYQSDFLFDI